MLEREELKLSCSVENYTGSAGAGEARTLVSIKNLRPSVTTAATEPDPRARIRIAPRFPAAISGGELRDVLQNGAAR